MAKNSQINCPGLIHNLERVQKGDLKNTDTSKPENSVVGLNHLA